MIAVRFYLTGLGPVGQIWPRWEMQPAQTADHKSLFISFFFPGDPLGSVSAGAHLYGLDNSIIHKHYPLQQEQSSWSVKAGGRLCSLSSELYLPPPSVLFSLSDHNGPAWDLNIRSRPPFPVSSGYRILQQISEKQGMEGERREAAGRLTNGFGA